MSFELVSAEGTSFPRDKERALDTIRRWVTQLDADSFTFQASLIRKQVEPGITQMWKDFTTNAKVKNVEENVRNNAEKAKRIDLRKLPGWTQEVEHAFRIYPEILENDKAWDDMCIQVSRNKRTNNTIIPGQKVTTHEHLRRCRISDDPSEKEMGIRDAAKKWLTRRPPYGPRLRDVIRDNMPLSEEEKCNILLNKKREDFMSTHRPKVDYDDLIDHVWSKALKDGYDREMVKKSLLYLQIEYIQPPTKQTVNDSFDRIKSDERLRTNLLHGDEYYVFRPFASQDYKKKVYLIMAGEYRDFMLKNIIS
ncbi:MAG: hypothetical protein CMI16_09695 [Opitutaceae bacterium]|nr:hypothetical protein [Opitutaceae bacterium]